MFKLLFSFLIFPFSVNASTELGNGGDTVLQAFNFRGKQIGYFLKENPQVAQKFGIDADKFLDVVRTTKLEAKEHLYLNKIEVDAINYPNERRIEVSRYRWGRHDVGSAFLIERRIALHEYLWIAGFDDSDYKISNMIILELEKEVGPLEDPDVHQVVLDKLCDTINKKDFKKAMKFLTWGLSLSQECSVTGTFNWRVKAPPITVLLRTYDGHPVKEDQLTDRMDLLRKLLVFGADPSGVVNHYNYDHQGRPILAGDESHLQSAMQAYKSDWKGYLDFIPLKILIEFGADPNRAVKRSRRTVFGEIMSDTWRPDLLLEKFMILLKAGGDVNGYTYSDNGYSSGESPARVIVRQGNQAKLVETLITQANVDWCRLDPKVRGRTDYGEGERRVFDSVLPEYLPLLQKYGISCPAL